MTFDGRITTFWHISWQCNLWVLLIKCWQWSKYHYVPLKIHFSLSTYYAVTYTLLNLDIIWWWYSVQDVTGVDGFPPSVRAEWIQTNINKKWNGGLKELRRKVSELLFSLKAMGACFKSQPGFQLCWAMLKPFFLICPNLHSLSLCFTKSQHAIICEVFSTPFHFQKFNNTTFFINIIFLCKLH